MRLLQLALITSALTLSACNEAPPPKQNPTAPAEFDSPPISEQVEPEPVPEPSTPVADIGGECSIEYTWSHDVPRGGGAHHVQLRWVRAGDEPAHWQVEDSWTPHTSSMPQVIRRTITDEQAVLAFEAGLAAIREFNFAKASSSAAADVPSVTLFVGSKEEATEIRFQDWHAASREVFTNVKAMLRELQAEVR